MKIYQIPFHSFVDAITNSSTTIYTYCENSVDAVKEMIQSFLDALDSTLKVDDMFFIGCMYSLDDYFDLLDELDNEIEENDDDDMCVKTLLVDMGFDPDNVDTKKYNIKMTALINDIITGKIEKPELLRAAEERYLEEKNDGCKAQTTLYLIPKDKKFDKLAKSIVDFLMSTEAEASYG